MWSVSLLYLTYIREKKVVTLVVLTTLIFKFSLTISQLLANAIPVRGATFRKARYLLAGLLLSSFYLLL
nr:MULTISPECIES: hypothetical protein [Limnobaculum]